MNAAGCVSFARIPPTLPPRETRIRAVPVEKRRTAAPSSRSSSARARRMTCETLTLEFAPDGAAHQAAVAGDEDSGAGLKVIAHSES